MKRAASRRRAHCAPSEPRRSPRWRGAPSRAAAAAYQLDPEHVRVRDAVIAPLLQRDGAGKPVLLSVDFEAKVAEPTRWSVLLAGAALGASAAVVLRKLAN